MNTRSPFYCHFFQSSVTWTRSVVLILSITVVILSLITYNYNSIPIFSLLLLQQPNLSFEEQQLLEYTHNSYYYYQLLQDMVQDRRLIATLVAAQASIFCPLFLLFNTNINVLPISTTRCNSSSSSNQGCWRVVIEQFCQFLMPFGLALSWVFCITFDNKTDAALSPLTGRGDYSETMATYEMLINGDDNSGLWWRLSLAGYVVNGLKYMIVCVLAIEVLVIWLASIKYAFAELLSAKKQPIQLYEYDDEEYSTGGAVGYLEEMYLQNALPNEKVVYI